MWFKYSKPAVIVIAVAVIISLGLTVYYYRDRFAPKPDYQALGYVQVKAKITNVLQSGRGIKLSTLLSVQYEYEGQKYSNTLRMDGYVAGQYNKGDSITRWLDPAHPETLIEK